MATTFAVPDGRVAMAATLWTGNSSTNVISNAVNAVSFQPDLIWIKARNAAVDHALQSSNQGISAGGSPLLSSNTTAAEITYAGYGVSAVSSTGFTVIGAGSLTNLSTSTYVGWQWKAGGTAVSNTAGTITSSVSANTTAGFSVVTYTGTGANATVGHGLGVAPGLILTKARNAAQSWYVYHSATGGTKTLYLNYPDVPGVDNRIWNNTDPTVSVFSIGTVGPNASAVTQVAYCWAPIAGYSAFGSYTGNGLADGTFIYTGFRPRYVLIKRTDASADWFINDTSREPYNLMSVSMRANTADPEASGGGLAMDALSNGFKMRDAGSGSNASSGTYIYAAFAENPLKYANAR
jgi:hypothetical protein